MVDPLLYKHSRNSFIQFVDCLETLGLLVLMESIALLFRMATAFLFYWLANNEINCITNSEVVDQRFVLFGSASNT